MLETAHPLPLNTLLLALELGTPPKSPCPCPGAAREETFNTNTIGHLASLFILRDITERRRLKVERLQFVEEMRMQEQLLISQGRFAAIGEIIGNIAHQWRQPLNTLGFIVQELPVYHKQGKLNQQYLEASANKAVPTISNMSQTIEDFRNFLKPDQARVYFRVREAVQRTVSLVEPSFHVMGLLHR